MSSDYLYIIDDIKRAETLSKINQGRDSIEDASTEENCWRRPCLCLQRTCRTSGQVRQLYLHTYYSEL